MGAARAAKAAMADRRITLDPVAAQLVRVAQDASGLTQARGAFLSILAPLFAQYGVAADAARIESEGDGIVLVVPTSVPVPEKQDRTDCVSPEVFPCEADAGRACDRPQACAARGGCLGSSLGGAQ